MVGWNHPRFDYVYTESFRNRYVLAASHVVDCEHIIEIGGAKTPIYNFLLHSPRTITVVDPFAESKEFQMGDVQVAQIGKCYHEVDYSNILNQDGKKGLVLIGFAPKRGLDRLSPNDDLTTLNDMLPRIHTVVIETMLRNSPGFHDAFPKATQLLYSQGFSRKMSMRMKMTHDRDMKRGDEFYYLFSSPRILEVFEKKA